MTRAEVIKSIGSALGIADPDEIDQPCNLLDVLEALAAAGLEGAKEHADAERQARTIRTAARARAGEVISFTEALETAPNRAARRALEVRGKCNQAQTGGPGGAVVWCELPRGHATSGLRNNEKHAARAEDGETWLRW